MTSGRAVVGELVVVRNGEAEDGLVASLGEGDRARLSTLAGSPREAFLAGRTALFRAARALGVGADARIVAVCPDCGGSHGRPTIEGPKTAVHLALTHAGGTSFAIAASVPIGIDAEPVDTPPERLRAIEALVPGRGDALRRWTAVEAVLKADGRGLRIEPSGVELRWVRARLGLTDYRLRTTVAEGARVTVAFAPAGIRR